MNPVKFVIAKGDRIIEMLFGKLTATGLILARIGLYFTAVAALMSYGFGKEMHWVHGLGLALLSCLTAILPEKAYDQIDNGKWVAGLGIVAFSIPMFVMEFTSHSGYAAGFRGVNVENAEISRVKWTGANNLVKGEDDNMKLWRDRITQLKADREALVAANPWAPTVKADALAAEIANLKDKVAAEIAGGRGGRKAGCKAECEKLKDQLVEAEKREGSVKRLNEIATEIDSLSSQISGTQRVIDKKQEVALQTEHKPSAIGHQAMHFAKKIAWFATGSFDASPSASTKDGAEHVLSDGLAYVFTFGPALAFFMAGLYRRKEDDHPATLGTGDPSVRPSANASPANLSAVTIGTQTASIPPELARGIAPSVLDHMSQNTTVTHRVLGAHALKEWAKSPEVRKLLAA